MTGNEARALRQGMRLSAAKLGLLIGTDESSVYRYEKRGNRQVPRMYERALRDVLRELVQENDDDGKPGQKRRQPPPTSAQSK